MIVYYLIIPAIAIYIFYEWAKMKGAEEEQRRETQVALKLKREQEVDKVKTVEWKATSIEEKPASFSEEAEEDEYPQHRFHSIGGDNEIPF